MDLEWYNFLCVPLDDSDYLGKSSKRSRNPRPLETLYTAGPPPLSSNPGNKDDVDIARSCL